MSQHLVVLKIGGSVLTNKAKISSRIRRGKLDFVVSEIARAYKNKNQPFDLLLGNGAGSYTHFLAHSYNIAKGVSTEKQFLGVGATHNEVRRVNLVLADALVTAGVPAFAVSPAGMITCQGGEVAEVAIRPLRLLLKNRSVPVVHGDTICDETLGSFILSTEKVFNTYLKQLKNDYERITVIYAMNEDGVLDQSGKVIPVISSKDEISIRSHVAHDVSDGITGKVQGARKALEFAQNVYIIGCSQRGTLQKAIAGQQVGTKII